MARIISGNYAQEAKCNTPRVRDVPESISELHSVTSELLALVQSMRDRLGPLIQSMPTESEGKEGVTREKCGLAQDIDHAVMQLHRARIGISDMLNMIEL